MNYSRINLPIIKHGAYLINIDKYKSVGTHWVALYVNGENETYFDSFGVEHIPKEMKKFETNKAITTNIYRIQAYNSIEFMNFMLKSKSFLDYTNLFSPSRYEKNDKTILKYF